MLRIFTIVICLFSFISCSKLEPEKTQKEEIIGIHLLGYTSDSLLQILESQLPAISATGINTIFLEIDYSFEFNSHPELIQGKSPITLKSAKKFAAIAQKNNLNIIPQFQCFGHQSWAKKTFPLLTVYPELDLTPGAFKDNESIYCREWNPMDPRVNKIVFPLINEIVAAFEAKAIHLGMDEVFLLDSVQSKTYGMPPASIFAKVVNQFHDHFVKEKKLDMYIWADRLIDGNQIKYGEWESSLNKTWYALDSIPKDIILADWHYNSRNTYKSVDLFLEKGFRVIPTSWKNLKAVKDFINYSYGIDHPKMIGHMFSTWGKVDSVATYEPMLYGINVINKKLYHNVFVESTPGSENIEVTLKSKASNIKYSFDNELPATESLSFNSPITITKSVTLNTQAYNGQNPAGEVNSDRFEIHKGLAAEASPNLPLSPKYETNQGIDILVNGRLGSQSFSDGEWAGFENNFDVTFNLKKNTKISSISIRSLVEESNSILSPKTVTLYFSKDGKNFTELKTKINTTKENNVVINSFDFDSRSTQYIRVVATQDQVSEKENGWLFIDEVLIQ